MKISFIVFLSLCVLLNNLIVSNGEENKMNLKRSKSAHKTVYKYYCWKICARPVWTKPKKQSVNNSKRVLSLINSHRRDTLKRYNLSTALKKSNL